MEKHDEVFKDILEILLEEESLSLKEKIRITLKLFETFLIYSDFTEDSIKKLFVNSFHNIIHNRRENELFGVSESLEEKEQEFDDTIDSVQIESELPNGEENIGAS